VTFVVKSELRWYREANASSSFWTRRFYLSLEAPMNRKQVIVLRPAAYKGGRPGQAGQGFKEIYFGTPPIFKEQE
jgi:hypothetical protein